MTEKELKAKIAETIRDMKDEDIEMTGGGNEMKDQYSVIVYIEDWEFKFHREVETFDTLQEAYDYYNGFALSDYYSEIAIDNPNTDIYVSPRFLAWRDVEGHREDTEELKRMLRRTRGV